MAGLGGDMQIWAQHGNTSKTPTGKGRYNVELSKRNKEYPKLFELKARGEVLLTQISNLFNTHYRLPDSSALANFEGVLGL